MTSTEKFYIDMEMAVESAKAGRFEFARRHFHRGMERAEEMSGEAREAARKFYKEVYEKHLA